MQTIPDNFFDVCMICRCEEVLQVDIKSAYDEGYRTPELIKRQTRITMGPCQGRMCRTAFQRLWRALEQENAQRMDTWPGKTMAANELDSISSLPLPSSPNIPGNRPPVRPLNLKYLAELESFQPDEPEE